MRLNVILFTIVLGGLISGAIFFIFGYQIHLASSPNYNDRHCNNYNDGHCNEDNSGQAFLLPISETSYSPVRDFNISEPVIEAGAAALFDVKSGRPLFSYNINKRLPIASITKLMAATTIVENLDLEEVYTVPAESVNVDGFGADLYRSERIRGFDLLKMMLIKSSNDAALTFVAEAQKRGIDLVVKMNERARQLGMTNTNFSDPAGLDDQSAFSTAADLVKLVRYASGFDLITNILATPIADVSSIDGRISHHLINTNQLLGRLSGIIFGKTGFTDAALGTMAVEVAVGDDDERVISIILGSQDRFGETRELVEWGRRAYRWE